MNFQALIVDDEPLARLRLRQLLEDDGDVQIVECENGMEAVRSFRRRRPDVLFLDVRMPSMDGFSILDELDAERLPLIVFVTAYDRYAVRAFEECALDYLLKPFDDVRFALTLKRIREQLAGTEDRPPKRPPFIAVAQPLGTRIVPACDIDWIDAAGNYVELHAGSEVILHRESLRSIETRLRGALVRVHRGVLVNPDKVRRLHWTGHGDGRAMLLNGQSVPVSRRYSAALRNLFSPARVKQRPA